MNTIIKNENAVYYECGFSCDNVLFLTLGSERFFITDSRYIQEAQECAKDVEVINGERELLLKAKQILLKSKIKTLIIDPLEWDIDSFEKLFSNLKIKIQKKPRFSQNRRILKSDAELQLIQKAVELGENAFENLAQYINITNPQSEQKLSFVLESTLRSFGKHSLSFEPIVAVNENAAKPHALVSKKKLYRGDLLLVDAGMKYKRYCSDRTRTAYFDRNISFDKEQHFSNKTIQKVYDCVKQAQQRAIEAIKPGIKAKKIDSIARDVIKKAGFGNFFIHSTGHGVGLDIHELPVISSKSETVLEEGMVFTVEPGIYLPSQFGVRIEDMVVVTKNGVKIL